NERLHLQRNGAQAIRRDHIVWERDAARAIGVAGGRIEQTDAESAEVSGALRVCRDSGELGKVRPLLHALPACEKEQLVFTDGAAKRTAVVIDDVFGESGGRKVEKVSGRKAPVGVMREHHAMKLVGAALGDDVNGSAACQTLLRIEVVGRDVYRLDRF